MPLFKSHWSISVGCRVASPQSLLGFNLIERRYTSVAHGLLAGFDCCVWCGARFHPLLVGALKTYIVIRFGSRHRLLALWGNLGWG